LDAEEKVVKNMRTVVENGKVVYYADEWVNSLLFTGTKKQIERRLMKVFQSTWVGDF
jgi:hypothetical protein